MTYNYSYMSPTTDNKVLSVVGREEWLQKIVAKNSCKNKENSYKK